MTQPTQTSDGDESRLLTLRFTGTTTEFFKLWIVNVGLSLFTLGAGSAWSKVRTQRYFYSHTLLDGTPLQYLGKPVPILKGRLIAALLAAVWFVTFNFWTELAFVVFVLALVVAPWVMVRSAAFTARHSAFRNLTFHFSGSAGGLAQRLYFGLLVTALSATLAFPRVRHALTRYFVERTSFGGVRAEFVVEHRDSGRCTCACTLGASSLQRCLRAGCTSPGEAFPCATVRSRRSSATAGTSLASSISKHT